MGKMTTAAARRAIAGRIEVSSDRGDPLLLQLLSRSSTEYRRATAVDRAATEQRETVA
jgi:hypothetical protein